MKATLTMFTLLGACSVVLGSSVYITHRDDDDIVNLPYDHLKGLFECILDWKPCSKEDASVKRLYPDLVLKACHKCTLSQKQKADTMLTRGENELPEIYEAYKSIFDPVIFKAFREALKV